MLGRIMPTVESWYGSVLWKRFWRWREERGIQQRTKSCGTEQSPASAKVLDRAQWVLFVPRTSWGETIITVFRLKGESRQTGMLFSNCHNMTPAVSQPDKFCWNKIGRSAAVSSWWKTCLSPSLYCTLRCRKGEVLSPCIHQSNHAFSLSFS